MICILVNSASNYPGRVSGFASLLTARPPGIAAADSECQHHRANRFGVELVNLIGREIINFLGEPERNSVV